MSPSLPSLVRSALLTLLAVLGLALGLATWAWAQDDGFDANGQCVGDQSGDGQVTVDELIVAVNNLLNGCQFVPVTLQFRGMVGDQPFVCGNVYHGIGTTNG